tara:strand:- start:123 stop:251 length:129 start_codon:yes stop_codon:yes gene_type:complete
MQFPEPIWKIIKSYKKEMEELDRFHAFLVTVFSNLILAVKSK